MFICKCFKVSTNVADDITESWYAGFLSHCQIGGSGRLLNGSWELHQGLIYSKKDFFYAFVFKDIRK